MHPEERNLLNSVWFLFTFNSDDSSAALYFDIKRAFNATWQSGFLCKFLTKISAGIITLINLFFRAEKSTFRLQAKRLRLEDTSFYPSYGLSMKAPPPPTPKHKAQTQPFLLMVFKSTFFFPYIDRVWSYMKGRNNSFVNKLIYFGAISDRRNAWRIHTLDTIKAKALRTFIIRVSPVYPLS